MLLKHPTKALYSILPPYSMMATDTQNDNPEVQQSPEVASGSSSFLFSVLCTLVYPKCFVQSLFLWLHMVIIKATVPDFQACWINRLTIIRFRKLLQVQSHSLFKKYLSNNYHVPGTARAAVEIPSWCLDLRADSLLTHLTVS